MNSWSKIIFTFFVFIFCIKPAFSQKFRSNYYYLGEIFDNREVNTSPLGYIYKEGTIFPASFVLPNGLINYLKTNLDTEMINKRDPYFLNLSLNRLLFSEKLDQEMSVNGQFDFSGSFFINIGEDSITVFPFKYTVKYKRPVNERGNLYEQLQSKMNDLNIRIENWFKKNYAVNQKLARHVTVRTSDFTPIKVDNDTLYYHQRKINIDDFTPLKKRTSSFAAAIFTSMGYQSEVSMSNDTVYLDFAIKVYQIKGMSWVLEEANSKVVLEHEQIHFDITQLVAEKFKERLREEALPAQDYDSRIQFLYLDYYRMINRMQNSYDNETKHGLDKDEQTKWQKTVRNELDKYLNNKKS
jgi:hypothetical protein